MADWLTDILLRLVARLNPSKDRRLARRLIEMADDYATRNLTVREHYLDGSSGEIFRSRHVPRG